jgi:23S rRNA pseudouridine955/2504/2580 synthase
MELVTEAADGQRLDNFLITLLKGAPKTYIYRIVRKGEVRVNSGRVKISHRLKEGDKVRIPPMRLPEPRQAEAATGAKNAICNAIIHEDDDFLVVNKPSGWAVHGGSGISFGVIEALRQARPELKSLELAHRLDRDTSGCLLLAKKRSRLRELHELIREHRVEKRYLTLVQGSWQQGSVDIDAPLLVNQRRGGERVVQVSSQGKESLTKFKPLLIFPKASYMQVELITGRTHQVRVHAAHAGHPVAGDERYGEREYNRWCSQHQLRRLFLHASRMAFELPSNGKYYEFDAPLGDDLKLFLDYLETKYVTK